MTTIDTARTDPNAARTPSRASRFAWPLLLLLLSAGAVTLVASAWSVNRAQRAEVARTQQRLAALEQQLRQLHAMSAELAAQAARNQHTDTGVQALRAELAALAGRNAQAQTAPRTAPAPDLDNAITGVHLDQVELLLLLAGQRARHDDDSTDARALYAQADAILARLPAAPDPAMPRRTLTAQELAALRGMLAAERNALDAGSERIGNAVPVPAAQDIADTTATAPPESAARAWWQRALAGWIDIRPSAELPPPAPSAESATGESSPPPDNPAFGSTLEHLRALRREHGDG